LLAQTIPLQNSLFSLKTAASMSNINITLPDGSIRQFDNPITGLELAQSIGTGLAKAAIAIKVDGTQRDLSHTINADASVSILTAKDDEGLEIMRHTATAQVLARAVKQLYPDAQLAIGPTIDDGFYYDVALPKALTPDDLPKIEANMKEIIKQNLPVTRVLWSKEKAIKYWQDQGNRYKPDIISRATDTATSDEVSIYLQGNPDNPEFVDLCRGPHMPNIGKISPAFKLTKVAGAYWRGDSNNEMLTRIYGTLWADKKDLQAYITRIEEAEKRDHRKLGKELDLFHFEDSAPGQPFWHDKGWRVYNTLLSYMRGKLKKYEYEEVNSPQVLDVTFWQYSGHWDKYRENMFVVDETAEQPMALKPMSCPGNVQIYKDKKRSYRELPIRMAEFGKVFRHESSGARHGLMRVQAFTQDDAHIFCTPQQLEDEVVKMCDLIGEVYRELGFEDVTIKFSTRPEQRIGSEEDWDKAEAALQKVCERVGFKWELNEGDGAFYAPKLDFVLRDAIGREWQCGTIQVDMNLPNRLDISYIDKDNSKQRPHLVHRAILGSFERFIGILIEHFEGKFPFWLAPTQVVVATITDEALDYAHQVTKQLKSAGISVELDDRADKISYKVREHSLQKVPQIWAVGKQEMEKQTVAIRKIGSNQQQFIALDEAINEAVSLSEIPV